jgi:hypothetical protein
MTPLRRGIDTVVVAEVGVAITVGAFRRPKANRKVEACQNRAEAQLWRQASALEHRLRGAHDLTYPRREE